LLLIGASLEDSSAPFVQCARERHPHIRIVCIDWRSEQHKAEARASGADAFVDLGAYPADYRGDRQVRRSLDALVESAMPA